MSKKVLLKTLSVILVALFITSATGCDITSNLFFEIKGVPASTGEKTLPDTEPEISVEDPDEIPVAPNEEAKIENEGPSGNATEDAEQEKVSETYGQTEEVPEPIPEVIPLPEPEPEPVVEYVPVTGISLTVYNVTLSVGHKTMPIVTMQPYNATDKGEIWQSSDTTVATVDYLGNIKGVSAGNCIVTVTSRDNSAVYATVSVTVNPEAECTYIDGILIANKTYPLPQSYAPGIDSVAWEHLNIMFNDAKQAGIYLFVRSGYRSYTDQKIIYNGYVKRDGKAAADRYSARPGHSEHQTGLAFDLNSILSSFEHTPEAKWIAENCHKYGFIIRYPRGKEHITGYMYEPWHVRYIGIEKATAVYESGLCLEEFLGITSVYSY